MVKMLEAQQQAMVEQAKTHQESLRNMEATNVAVGEFQAH